MLDTAIQEWGKTSEDLYQAISQNPRDKTTIKSLLGLLTERSPNRDDTIASWVTAKGYKDMIIAMEATPNLEERQRLLSTEAPLLTLSAQEEQRRQRSTSNKNPAPNSAAYFPEENKPPIWYDITSGLNYNIRPLETDTDPFAPFPDSMYQLINGTLARTEFHFETGADLGSGPGETSRILAAHCKNVIAIDKFPFWHDVAKKRAQAKGITNISYELDDLSERIPLPDHSMDVLFSNGLTAFIPTDAMKKHIEEIHRVLKPGGVYFEPEFRRDGMVKRAIKEEMTKDPKTLSAYLIGKLATLGDGQTGGYPHSSTKIDDMFRDRGFSIREIGATSGSYVTGISVVQFTSPKT